MQYETAYFSVMHIRVRTVRGCADMTVGDRLMSVRRADEVTTVTCNRTGERWHFLCRDGHWFGIALSNCTTQRNSARSREIELK